MTAVMIVIKAPAGFDPTWPAIPVNPTCAHASSRSGLTLPVEWETLDLAALLGPKDCERCGGEGEHEDWNADDSDDLQGAHTPWVKCEDCSGGKVPQRVALAIETPCQRCEVTPAHSQTPARPPHHVMNLNPLIGRDLDGPWWVPCPDCDASGVRLRVEYTAQVDAVYPIRTCTDHTAHVCGGASWLYVHHPLTGPVDGETEIDISRLLTLADWSPDRLAVLISDVRRWQQQHVFLKDGQISDADCARIKAAAQAEGWY